MNEWINEWKNEWMLVTLASNGTCLCVYVVFTLLTSDNSEVK